jgi:hypothetical protein
MEEVLIRTEHSGFIWSILFPNAVAVLPLRTSLSLSLSLIHTDMHKDLKNLLGGAMNYQLDFNLTLKALSNNELIFLQLQGNSYSYRPSLGIRKRLRKSQKPQPSTQML